MSLFLTHTLDFPDSRQINAAYPPFGPVQECLGKCFLQQSSSTRLRPLDRIYIFPQKQKHRPKQYFAFLLKRYSLLLRSLVLPLATPSLDLLEIRIGQILKVSTKKYLFSILVEK